MKGADIPHKMLKQDAYSSWLGIEILESEIGKVRVGMTIRKEMLNGMGKAHGGITYSLADSVFGFTSNTHGKFAVSIETSINHIVALNEGDYLISAEDANGCTVDSLVPVANQVTFTTTVIAAIDENCGQGNGSIDIDQGIFTKTG